MSKLKKRKNLHHRSDFCILVYFIYVFFVNLTGPFSFQESILRPKELGEDRADARSKGDNGRKANTAYDM